MREVLDSAVLAEHYAIFREAERVIADPIVRNRGTVGGSLCQADPSEDLSAVGAALKGTVVIRGSGGRAHRGAPRVPRGPVRDQGRRPAEILTEVRFPIRPGAGSAYEKVERRVGDWPVASAGAYVVVRDGTGHRLRHRPHGRRGRALLRPGGRGVPRRQGARARRTSPRPPAWPADSCHPSADQRGPVDYKQHLADELTLRALRRAARGQPGSLTCR